MHSAVHAALTAALVAAGSCANAHSYAEITFAGMDMSVTGSGTAFNGFVFGQPISGGTSLTVDFPYTITLHAEGKPAERGWDFCVPLPETDCGPAPTGYEQVEFESGALQTREASPFTSYQFSGIPSPNPMIESDGTVTYHGTLSITETVAPEGTYQDLDYLFVFAATWVDSNDALPAVPEPATASLMLLALGLVVANTRNGGRHGRHAGTRLDART